MVVEGNVAFSNVTQHDVYNGQSTGKYSLTVTLPEDAADTLVSSGVRVKTYAPEEGEPMQQRKFSSKYDVRVLDSEGQPYGREIPRGSLVRIKYKLGNEHPVHGVSTYLEAVKVLEEAEMESSDEDF